MAQQETMTLLLDVQIEAEKAVQNQKDLIYQLSVAKKELDDLKKSEGMMSDAYIAQEATVKQLNQQLAANGRVLTAMADNTSTASGAYAALNKEAADAARLAKDMAAAYGSNNSKTVEAVAHAKELSDQLKEVDASVGQNQRNIGNYPQVFDLSNTSIGRFQSMLQGFGGTATTVGGVAGNAFTGMKTQAIAMGKAFLTPPIGIIVLVLGAIMLAAQKLSAAFKKNDEASTKLEQAFAQFKPIAEAISWVFDKIAVLAANLILGFSKMASAVLSLIPAYKKSAEAAEKLVIAQDRLEEKEREYTVNSALRNKEIARLKKEAVNTQKYTDEQIAAMLKKADDLALKNFEEDKKRKAETLRILIAKAKQEKDTSDETANAIAQARAAMYQSEEAYFSETMRLATKANAAAERIQKDKEDKEKAANERAEQRRKEQQEKIKARDDKNKKWREEQTEAEIKAFDDAQKKMIASREEALKKLNDLTIGIEEEPEVDTGSAVKYLEDVEAAKQAIRESSDLVYLDYQQTQLDLEYQAAIANAKKIGVSTTAIDKAYSEQKKKLAQAEISAKMDLASGFANNIAEIFGKQTKVGKLAASAAIAIDTAKGAMAAFTSMQSIPVVGTALGVAAAGAVIAKGARSIKDVWAVKSGLPGDGGGGGASVPTGAMSGASSTTGSIVARQSGSTQQQLTQNAVDSALKMNPSQPVLVVPNLTEVQNNMVQLKADNSL